MRVCKAVGIHHQNVSLVETERAGFIRGGIEQPQDSGVRFQFFDFSRGGTEQVGGIMSRADELSHAIRAEEKEEERNELVGKRLFAKELVHPVQDLLRLGPVVKLQAESAKH